MRDGRFFQEAAAASLGNPGRGGGWLGVTPTTNRSGRTVPLKTTGSAATVDLLPALVRELRAHRARRAALGIQLVRADALAFSTLTGKPHHQRSALRAVQNAAADAKLGHVTAHDLRHSLVANALDAGLTLAEASRLARHASPAVTASVYADVLEAKRDRSARSSHRQDSAHDDRRKCQQSANGLRGIGGNRGESAANGFRHSKPFRGIEGHRGEPCADPPD